MVGYCPTNDRFAYVRLVFRLNGRATARAWRPALAALAGALALLGANGIAHATAKTWNTTTGNWSSASNWSPSGVPGSSDTVTFNNASGGTVTLDANVDVSSLTVSGSGVYTIAPSGAQTIRVRNNLTLSANSGSFTFSSATTEIDGAFLHTGSMTVNANGGTLGLYSTGSVSHTWNGASWQNVTVGQSVTSSLVGYWKLDEATGSTFADSSGNVNTGTLSGTGTRTTPPSTITFSDANALSFDGSSTVVSLGTTNLPANGAAQSISLWFKGNPNGGNENMLAMSNLSSGSAVQIGFRGSALIVWSYGGTGLVSGTAPTDGLWHHVAYTYDGTTDIIYLDGSVLATNTSTHQTATPTSAYLGTYDGSSEKFSGALDDARVYSRALSATEVTTLAGGSNAITPGTHTFSDAFVATGTFTISGGTVTGSNPMTVGTWQNSATYSGTGLVTLTGAATSNIVLTGGNSFGSLTVNGAGDSFAFNDALTTTGDFKITAGTVTGSNAISVGGNWSNAGTFSGTGTVTLTGTGTQTITSGNSKFSALILNGSGGTYTIQDRLWVPNSTITLTNGTLNGGSSVIHLGAFSVGSGTFAAGTGTVVLDSQSSQSLPVTSFNALRIDDGSETNLVGYWKLDQGAGTAVRDWSGNNNDGTLSATGASWQTSVPSGIGFDDAASVAFNGSSGYATLGANNMPSSTSAQTISFWVNFSSTGGNQNAVVLTNGSNGIQVGLRGGKLTVWPFGATTTLVGASAPATGSWHHVVYTYDGTTDILYLDGVGTSGSFTHPSITPTAVYLGTYSPAAELLSGSLDDVRVYNVALTAAEVAQLAAGRYAGTGGYATTTLSAATTISGQLAIDAGILNANGKTLTASLTSSAAQLNTGTYTVGSAAQTFSGGLTVQPNGTLTLASSGGSVKIASAKTLTIDGTLNASSTGATIQSVSGNYAFTVGSTAGATPTLNISGLAVKNTDSNGMAIGSATSALPVFTKFDNIAFSNGTGTQLLQIKAASLYLSSAGCSFDGGQAATTTYSVSLTGNGTSDGETRAVFGGATCASSAASCQATKKDDDPGNDGVGDTSTNAAVVQFVRSVEDDTAGTLIGFPTAAFNWNTFTYYSTYAAFHNASGGTSDVIYVRDESGNPLYSWTVPTAGETITGTPQWNTVGSTHYVYVATSAGKVYRLIDTATGTTSGTLSIDSSGAWSSNPYNCSCTIVTPLALDTTNLYFGGSPNAGGQGIWTVGQSNESIPTGGAPLTVTPTITSTALAKWTSGSTTYLFAGTTGNILKINVSSEALTATNTLPGSGVSVLGRISLGTNGSTTRVYAGDDNGTMWALDASNFTATGKLWSYNTANAIKGSSYYDTGTDTIQYGTQGGTIIVLNGSGSVLHAGFPYTPAGGSGDPIIAAPLFYSGVLVVGSTGGKLYFLDRNTGAATASIIREYNFGPTESVSGIAYDVTANRYMITTSSTSSKDGRIYYFDQITDPTAGSS